MLNIAYRDPHCTMNKNVHVYKIALIFKFFLSSSPLTLRNMFLKVPSGQIGSAWEWYHWIGLEKDINCYRFLIFKFQFWMFETTSKFWASSYKNESNLLLVRITVCKESFLPIGWHTFIWWKNPPKGCTILVWLWNVGILHSWAVIPHFWSTVHRKRSQFVNIQTVIQTRRLEAFLYWAAQNFELQNIKN